MAVAAFQGKGSNKLRAFPVICDKLTGAAVVVIHRQVPPRRGFRFSAFGQVWEVVQEASLTRGAVARPVRPGPPTLVLTTATFFVTMVLWFLLS